MKEQILKILDTVELPELEKQRLTDALLILFNVSHRRELLLAYEESRESKEINTPEGRVNAYLRNNNQL